MSGRGHGRGRGRQPFGGRGFGGRGSSGRGYNNNRNGNGKRGSQVNKKKTMKFHPNSATDEKYEGYAKIMSVFLLDVEKTYDGANKLIEAIKDGN